MIINLFEWLYSPFNIDMCACTHNPTWLHSVGGHYGWHVWLAQGTLIGIRYGCLTHTALIVPQPVLSCQLEPILLWPARGWERAREWHPAVGGWGGQGNEPLHRHTEKMMLLAAAAPTIGPLSLYHLKENGVICFKQILEHSSQPARLHASH